MKKLHRLRYSFTEPYQYMNLWESQRNDINKDLDRIQNGDMDELMVFQKNTKDWVEGVNKEFETAQLRKNGRLLIDDFFEETTVTNQIWKENLGILDSDLSMHMKFSLEPKTLFVKKDVIDISEFDSFKAEVNEKLSMQDSQISEIIQAQKIMAAKQEDMAAKQDDMSADLKAILAILSQK
ncbi:hypothetical protein A2U01_0013383 [Trifolium medium]|uniref:Uncharacterized protein n=1 Tax=Trifolium medium TaxID=97028 RepID=A0A392N1S4_9FABA|nr:hypothetical protein [Trifolium medium]